MLASRYIALRDSKLAVMPNPNTPQTLTERAKGSLLDFAERAFSEAIDDSYRSLTDLPGLIADPDPPSPTFILPKALSRQACRRWARGDTIVRGPGFDSPWAAICGPYLDTIGENPDPGSFVSPFPGGQCVGASYSIGTQGTATCPTSTGDFTILRSGTGPVSIIGKSTIDTGLFPRPLQTTYTISFGDGVQTMPVRHNIGVEPCLRVFRTDGGSDNCGNLIPDYLPPITPTGLPPLPPTTVDLPGIGPVDVDIEFDDDGNVIVKLPDLGIEVTAPNPFGPGSGDGGGGGDPFPPGFQGTPGDSQDVTGEPAEGDDPDRFLVGVLVETIEIPPRVKTRWNASSAYYAGLYYVYMGGDDGYAQHPAALAKLDEFFYAPEGANRFIVEPNDGVTVRVTPFWREPLE